MRGRILSETNAKLYEYYSDSAPSYGMVQKWFTEFRCGRTITETIASPVRPNEITTLEMINKIHDIVLNDPKVKVHEIAENVSIWTERVVNILHTHLCMRKLCARRVPRLLTINQKSICVTTSEQNLVYFNRNLKEFLCRFVPMDEMWIHYYNVGSREGPKQWVKPGESAPKRPKKQQSAGEVMANVFWDADGVIFIAYLEKRRTITALLDRSVDEIRKNGNIWRRKKSFFMMTMRHITHRILHRQKSMNWISNHLRIHRILQTWHPANIICSQTSRDGCVVGVLSRTKKLNGKQEGILEGLTNRIIWKAWRSWEIVERSLNSLYRAKRRVNWKIKPIFAKNINYFSFYHANIKHPSILILFVYNSNKSYKTQCT